MRMRWLIAGIGSVVLGIGCSETKKPADPEPARIELDIGVDEKPGAAVQKVPSSTSVGPNEWSQVGDVRIRAVALTVGKPTVVEQGRESVIGEDLTQIAIEVENVSKTKKLDYYPLGFDARLSDEHGNKYVQKRLFDYHLKGAVDTVKTVHPGAPPFKDVLAFEPPVQAATVFHLSIDSPVRGEKGKFEFRIPASAWKK